VKDEAVRERLIHAFRGDESHIEFEAAIDGVTAELAARKLPGAPHTIWQLVEHMRIALHDLVEFSRDPKHESPKWPEGYWPQMEAPKDEHEWEKSVAAFQKHAREMEDLITGESVLREALVAGSHNSYHLGQLVFLKRCLLAT
jgi:hypothetical protein